MAKQSKLDKNTPALDAFIAERQSWNSSTIVWTTYCKVTREYAGVIKESTEEIWIRNLGGKYQTLELRGIYLDDEEEKAVFSAKQATFIYNEGILTIQGTRNGKYYKVTIGAYDEEYASKCIND